METRIALVDDHILLRGALKSLIEKLGYEVLFEAGDGRDFIQKLDPANLPGVVLLDINMGEGNMDGFETAQWLKKNYPEIRILVLSMNDKEEAIIKMLRYGARGYILKESEASELKIALDAVITRGFHYSDLVTGRLIHSIHSDDDEVNNLSEREIEFLKLAASEMTYKEIADKMYLSPRTIDGYRDALFEKLDLKSRVGLVLYAIKNGIVNLQ